MPRWQEIDSEYLGKRVNSWTIIEAGLRINRDRAFLCRCDCGSELKITRKRLETRPSKGCARCYGGHALGKNHPRYRGDVIPQEILGRLKRNAATRGIEVFVTLNDLLEQFTKQNGLCALSGIALVASARPNGTASVDRIDSLRPYTKENIQWVHKDVNKMKSNLSDEYFVKMCALVAAHKGRNVIYP